MLHRLQSNAIIEFGLEQLPRFVWLISAICTRLETSLERRPKSGVPSLQSRLSLVTRDNGRRSKLTQSLMRWSASARGWRQVEGMYWKDKELEKWANDSGVFVHSSYQMMVVIDQIFFVHADYIDRR